MRDDDLTSMEYAKTLRVLAWGALLLAVLVGASLLQCVSGPQAPRTPTPLEQCAHGCKGYFTWIDSCLNCVEPGPGQKYAHDRPASCVCEAASPFSSDGGT